MFRDQSPEERRIDNEGDFSKARVEAARPMRAEGGRSDRAPAISEIATHISEEVDALHQMIRELEGLLEPVLTPENPSKTSEPSERPGMSDLGGRLWHYRDGIHAASNRLRELINRVDI